MTDYRIYRLSFSEWILYGGFGVMCAAAASYVFYRSFAVFLVFAPVGALYPLLKRKELINRRKARLLSEFREGISALSSALSAGFSLENSMKESEAEMWMIYGSGSLIAAEFAYINHRVGMNIPVEQAWEEFAERSNEDDVRNFAGVVKVAKRSGGEIVSIIAHTADTIGDKIHIEDEIRTMTAAKRFEQKIMNAIPIGIVLYIEFTSPGFFDSMYASIGGRAIMTACMAVYIAAIYLSGKILDIEI